MADGNGQYAKVLSRLIDLAKKLPLKKITGNQAFDLFFDLIMLCALWVALRAELSADRKFALAIMCVVFMATSLFINRPIRHRTRK